MPYIDNTTSPAEVAYEEGQPLTLGTDGDYEVEQNPLTGRLEITDTASGETAYVDPDRAGTMGGDGVFIRSLAQGKPLADDGTLYDTIQAAENAASAWLFIPPGTFTENITVGTEGLTIAGGGYGTYIDGGISSDALTVNAKNVTVRDLSLRTDASGSDVYKPLQLDAAGCTAQNVTVRESMDRGINITANDCVVHNCEINNTGANGITSVAKRTIIANSSIKSSSGHGLWLPSKYGCEDIIVANCTIWNPSSDGINAGALDGIFIGNRVHGAGDNGIETNGNSTDCIVANNRISGSTNADLSDAGTGTLLDANVTGAAN